VVILLALANKGDYAAYGKAFILFQLPHAIFTVSIVTALLPAMSSRWADRDVAGMRALLARGVRATGVVLIPAALGYIAIGREIVRLVLEHGETESRSGDLVADVLALFAVGLFFFSMFQLLLRAFYAMQDTRTPALINTGSFVVNTGVNLLLVLVLDMGVRGLALGHATSYVFSSSVALLVLRRRLGGLRGERIGRSLGGTLVAGGLTAVAAWGTAQLIEGWLGIDSLGARAVQVAAAIAVGLGVFLLAALILRLEEVDTVRRHMLARWR
jgi:putative peptidoglycan lipid II flippase